MKYVLSPELITKYFYTIKSLIFWCFGKKQFWNSCVQTHSSLVLGALHFGFISSFTKFKMFACMELFELGDNLPNLMSSFAELSFLKKDYLYIEITLLRMKLNIHSIHLYFILEFQLIRTRGICAQHLDISKIAMKIYRKY